MEPSNKKTGVGIPLPTSVLTRIGVPSFDDKLENINQLSDSHFKNLEFDKKLDNINQLGDLFYREFLPVPNNPHFNVERLGQLFLKQLDKTL